MDIPLLDQNKRLTSEIGLIVASFEGLLENVRKQIFFLIASEEDSVIDYHYIEILLHDTTARSLSDYLKAVAFYYLDKNYIDNGYSLDEVSHYKKLVKRLCDLIVKAAEFRDDIVHSSYDLYSLNDFHPELTAKRTKVSKEGLETKSFTIFIDAAQEFYYAIEQTNNLMVDILQVISLKESLSMQTDFEERASKIDFTDLKDSYFDSKTTPIEELRNFKAVIKRIEERRKSM